MNLVSLPIDTVLDQLRVEFERRSSVILSAPPGSGKTTRVAPYLIESLKGIRAKQAILLQPRRVAAKATAMRIAEERGWRLGGRVGYSVRFDSKVSAETQLLVATEGVLLRRLQSDPLLDEVGLVILDEFHERSISTDLLLGMLRRIQTSLRPDLKILVMSATMAMGPLQAYLDDSVTIEADGRLFPVDLLYRPAKHQQPLVEHVVESIRWAAEKSSDDILVFLPGVGEINRSIDQLQRDPMMKGRDLLPLHGSLPLEEQTRTLFSGPRPRVVLATNVAETSLTLEGIRLVIDSGVARVNRFDPKIGLDRLELEPICQASATQRAGRAGRLESGKCIRLWDHASQKSRPEHLDPEIRRVDIVGPILQLFEWGEGDGAEFPWLQPPRPEAVESAVALLHRLGALHGNRITNLGKTMASLPVAPRLARLLVEGHRRGQLENLSWVAAMLSERDPFQRSGSAAFARSGHTGNNSPSVMRWNSDLFERLRAIEKYRTEGTELTPFGMIHRNAVRTLADTANQLADEVSQILGKQPQGNVRKEQDAADQAEQEVAQSLVFAFPDRLAKRRAIGKPKGLMVGGKGVALAPSSGVQEADLFLCIDVDGGSTDATVRQASAVDESWLPTELVQIRDELFYHPTQRQVVARRRRYWDDLLLSETPVAIEDQQACSQLLYDTLSQDLSSAFPSGESSVSSYLMRIRSLREWAPDLGLPTIDDEWIKRVLRQICNGRKSLDEVNKGPWRDWMQSELTQEQVQAIEQHAPERIRVPSGSWIRIDYELGKPPVLAVRIQEVFSWKSTPRIAFGRVPLLLHLLAPNMRPQQITDDLESFWKNTYEIVRKELKRRYPKHSWPEDPTKAEPIAGVRKK